MRAIGTGVRIVVLAVAVLVLVGGCMSTTDVLARKTWRLAQVHGAAPVAAATLSFASGGTLTLQTGCNTVGGPFHLDGNQIIVGDLQQTLTGCQGAVADQEAAILAVIRNRPAFVIESGSGQLQLTSDAGQVLVFDPE